MAVLNRVNMEKVRETVEKAKADPATAIRNPTVEGEWLLGEAGGPQFRSKVKTLKGEFTLDCDNQEFQGGGETAPNPIQYCLYGAIACFASTYAAVAAEMGVKLETLKIKATADIDLSRSWGLSDNPILRSLSWDLTVKADASEETLEKVRQLAFERCPAVYCLTHEIHPRISVQRL